MTKPRIHRISGPGIQPVSVEDAKKQLEIASSDSTHDVQIAELIEAAREQFEHDTGFVTTKQTFEVLLSRFPENASPIEIPVRPTTSIVSIVYRDHENQTTLLASDAVRLDRRGRMILLAYGGSWPAITEQTDAIIATIEAGHATASDVPKLAKRAIQLQIAKWFEDRDMYQSKSDEQFDQAYERIVRRMIRTTYP